MGLYGGPSRVLEFEGKKIYAQVDSETGATTWYEKRFNPTGTLNDIKLGTVTPPDKKFVKHEGTALGGLFPDGFSDVFEGESAKKFLSDEGQKTLRDQAAKTAKDGCIAVEGSNKEACGKIAEDLIAKGETSTTPDTTADEIATETTDKFAEQLASVQNEVGTNIGITQEIGSKPLRYPTDMAENQDVIKFSLIKYKANKPKTGATFGRERISPNAKVGNGDRLILGTVILPVPGQIQDSNKADWSEDSANAKDLALAGLFGSAVSGDADTYASGLADGVAGNSEALKTAVTGALAKSATGVNVLGRMGGLVVNPNLELLFSKPSLREFSLSFRLSARSKTEGQEIIKIIRFFKQGMAPIRDPSNLFLKSPNTFQVNYLLRGKDSKDHPFIGRMKECALTSVNTNYTPENNYATYEDGLMISYQISLSLKELEPVYNDNYKDIPTDAIGF